MMRKVNQFSVAMVRASAESERQDFSSWHKVWELAISAFRNDKPELISVFDPLHQDSCVAIFSMRSLDSAPSSLQAQFALHKQWKDARWQAEPMDRSGSPDNSGFVNMNISEFHWEWIDGAKHEIPFRLSFLERRAKAHPNGVCAMGLDLLSEWRDWLDPRATSHWHRV